MARCFYVPLPSHYLHAESVKEMERNELGRDPGPMPLQSLFALIQLIIASLL